MKNLSGLAGGAIIATAQALGGNTAAAKATANSAAISAIRGVTNKYVNAVKIPAVATAMNVLRGANILNGMGLTPNILNVTGLTNNSVTQAGINAADSMYARIQTGEIHPGNFDQLVSSNFLSAADVMKGINANTSTLMEPSQQYLMPTTGIGSEISALESLYLVATPELKKTAGNENSASTTITTRSPVQTSYAKDLTDQHYLLKHDFLYVVGFDLNPPFDTVLQKYNNFSYLVRKIDRPSFKIDHEEVNMYNFRTHVPKKTDYSPIKFELLDDETSGMLEFVAGYMYLMSPSMRFDVDRLSGLSMEQLQESVLRFVDPVDNAKPGFIASSLSTLIDNRVSIIKQIHVFHIHTGGIYFDQYTFTNPKFTEIAFDELDMVADSDTCVITGEFVYDTVTIKPKQFFYKNQETVNKYIQSNIAKLTPRPARASDTESTLNTEIEALVPGVLAGGNTYYEAPVAEPPLKKNLSVPSTSDILRKGAKSQVQSTSNTVAGSIDMPEDTSRIANSALAMVNRGG